MRRGLMVLVTAALLATALSGEPVRAASSCSCTELEQSCDQVCQGCRKIVFDCDVSNPCDSTCNCQECP